MNQSQIAATISEELKAEAFDCLLKHLQGHIAEAGLYAKEALPKFASYIAHGGIPPEDVYPWVQEMMFHAVMPDHSVCERTKREQFKIHVTGMVTSTPPRGTSLELRRAMVEHGYVYSYYDTSDEGDDAEFAEATGYGIAKLLGIDLYDFITQHWPTASAT